MKLYEVDIDELLLLTEMVSEPFPSPLVAPDSEDLWGVDGEI